MSESSADERNQAPSARRIQHARRSGQVAFSRDLAAALAMAVICVVLATTASSGVAGLLLCMREALGSAARAGALSSAAMSGFELVLLNIAVPGGALVLVACLAGVVQARGLATVRPLRPDARRVLPALARVLGRERAFEAGKGLFALCMLFAVAFWSVRPTVSDIAALGGASAARILLMVGVLGKRLAIHLTVAMLAFGAIDYFWQRYRHGKALRMSWDEVKREHRESEGEPTHKAERLRLHHEFMQEQTLGNVAGADLVVVHAGVMAAAIRYERKGSRAPVVIMKGEGARAQAIVAAARTAGVSVFADLPWGQALASVDEGEEIPQALFEPVAKCLLRAETMVQPES